MELERRDPLKVFIGFLNAGVNKPKVLEWLQWFELEAAECHVPEQKQPGKLGVAFVTFSNAEAAQKAVVCFNGLIDADISPCMVKAQRVAITWES